MSSDPPARVPPPSPLEVERATLLSAVRRALQRAERRATAIGRDLERIAEARSLAAHAAWIVSAVAKVPRGARTLEYVDWSTGEAVTRAIPLDPARSARAQIDDVFRKAKRLRDGEPVARARLAKTEGAIAALRGASAAIEAAPDLVVLTAIVAQVRRDAPEDARTLRKPTPPGKKPPPRDLPRPPYRAFAAPSGRVLVGRGADHNDALTFHVAKPYHLWLHARGVPGAHVVVPLKREQTCPGDLLVDAAHLAAHFSDARGETTVEVSYVLRKHVRKPRKASPGAVVIDREKVLVLRLEEARLARLLAAEEL